MSRTSVLCSSLFAFVAGSAVAQEGTESAPLDPASFEVEIVESRNYFSMDSTKGTKAGLNAKLRISHDCAAAVRYVLLYVRGFDKNDKPIRINEHYRKKDEAGPIPFYRELEGLTLLVWFDQPLRPKDARLIDAKLPMNPVAAIDSERRAQRLTFQVLGLGAKAQDAIDLLGNQLMTEDHRVQLADRLLSATDKRYRYLNDQYEWVFSPAAQVATNAQQVTGELESTGRIDSLAAELVIHNKTRAPLYVRLAGQGQIATQKIEPQKAFHHITEAGLLSVHVRTEGGAPRTWVVDIKRGHRYETSISM